jgi:hypothetical protein
VSRSTETYNTEIFALDGKTRFGFSANGMLGTGWGIGGTVTVFEKFISNFLYIPNFSVDPSVFISAKYFVNDFDPDERKRFFAGGAGILFKRRLTRNERLLLALGLSLEYLAGSVEKREEDYDYSRVHGDVINYSGDIGLLGMGVQGGLSYRLTPALSLDINGLVKFGFGSVEIDGIATNSCDYRNHSFSDTPIVGGVEIGVSFMF